MSNEGKGGAPPESWLQAQLRRHSERFRCAICDKPSRTPAYEAQNGGYSWSNWNRPGDLFWCRDCGRYFCAEHYVVDRGYCRDCMLKHYPPTDELPG